MVPSKLLDFEEHFETSWGPFMGTYCSPPLWALQGSLLLGEFEGEGDLGGRLLQWGERFPHLGVLQGARLLQVRDCYRGGLLQGGICLDLM